MVYLYKNKDSYITTDNITEYRYDGFNVFLDDLDLGYYTNLSDSNIYIKVLIPSNKLNLDEKEYKLKFVSSYITIKEELGYVKSLDTVEIKEHTKQTSMKFYEKN